MAINKKKLFGNIAFYTFAALLYGFIIFELVVKFNNGNVYLFGYRFDVVLTGSMSERNENHKDFLEGTSQIHAFDLVTSKKVEDNTELKLKDVVLFQNPDLNNKTDMHRIVDVIEKGDQITFQNVNLVDFNNKKGIEFVDYSSSIGCSSIDMNKMTLTYTSSSLYNSDYTFQVGTRYEEPTSHSSVDVGGGIYEHTITFERSTSAPTHIYVRLRSSVKSYITSWKIECLDSNTINVKPEDYVPNEEKTNSKSFNIYYLYEIRGDAAKDSDGIFQRKDIISKVTGVTPKLGYFVRFITSIPGMILIIGCALIITIFAYLYNKPPKAKKELETADTSITSEKEPNEPKNVEEATDVSKKKKVETTKKGKKKDEKGK